MELFVELVKAVVDMAKSFFVDVYWFLDLPQSDKI